MERVAETNEQISQERNRLIDVQGSEEVQRRLEPRIPIADLTKRGDNLADTTSAQPVEVSERAQSIADAAVEIQLWYVFVSGDRRDLIGQR